MKAIARTNTDYVRKEAELQTEDNTSCTETMKEAIERLKAEYPGYAVYNLHWEPFIRIEDYNQNVPGCVQVYYTKGGYDGYQFHGEFGDYFQNKYFG